MSEFSPVPPRSSHHAASPASGYTSMPSSPYMQRAPPAPAPMQFPARQGAPSRSLSSRVLTHLRRGLPVSDASPTAANDASSSANDASTTADDALPAANDASSAANDAATAPDAFGAARRASHLWQLVRRPTLPSRRRLWSPMTALVARTRPMYTSTLPVICSYCSFCVLPCTASPITTTAAAHLMRVLRDLGRIERARLALLHLNSLVVVRVRCFGGAAAVPCDPASTLLHECSDLVTPPVPARVIEVNVSNMRVHLHRACRCPHFGMFCASQLAPALL
jgi:hypothetical protein